ncbi:MAG TPA: trypsin-like peptidase domain-containing protein, partial [Phycisphaerae bacterium]|nr:trypsin-like peptidase domain-containing protein [Phycisphaerae bacterium]
MNRSSRVVVISSAAAVVATGVLVGLANFSGYSLVRADSTTSQQPLVAPQSVQAAQSLSEAFEAVHQAVANSVVNIYVEKSVDASDQAQIQPQEMPDLPPQFKNLLPPGFQGPGVQIEPQQPQKIEGTGSGVILSYDGYIVTNNHVVGDATKIKVTLNDGTTYTAKIVGTDPKTDLAVIKIDAKDLQPAQLGDSDQVEVGQWVCAFGSPFGLSQTMTQGIISATGRTDVNIIAEHNPNLAGLTYEDFLQ